MTHYYSKFQPFTETFSLLPYSLYWMTCLHIYAFPIWCWVILCWQDTNNDFVSSTVTIMRNAMSRTHFISTPGQDDCVAVTLEAVIRVLCFAYWQVFVAWLPVPLGNSDCFVICCFLYGTWSQGFQSLSCLSGCLVGLLSHMHVSVVWRFWRSGGLGQAFWKDRRHIHFFQRNFILQSHHFFET